MEYQLQYNICAVIIYFIVLITHLMHKKTKEKHNMIFTMMVVNGLIGVIVNIINTKGNMNPKMMNSTVRDVLNYVYFVSLNLSSFLYALYVMLLTKNSVVKLGRWMRMLLYIPIIIMAMLIISNPYIHGLFKYVDGVYARGNLQFIMFITNMYYVIFGIMNVLYESKYINKQLKMALIMFMIISCDTSIIQIMFPELLLQHLGIAVCQLILLLNIQKPDEYLNTEYGVYNRNAFERIFNMNIMLENKMEILIVNIEDLNFLIQALGAEVEMEIVKSIAGFLDKISHGNVYYIEKSTFFILDEKKKKGFTDSVIDKINNQFGKKWEDNSSSNGEGKDSVYKGDDIFVNHKLMRVLAPDEVNSLDALYFCNSSFEHMTPDTNDMVDIKNIDIGRVDRKLQIEKIIKRAVKEDNFQVYYQPIYSFEKDKIVSAEALIRLDDPEEGFVSPNEFIPIAERNGSIIKIGNMVLEKVFNFIKNNDIKENGINYIEINLSVIQCMQSELADNILKLMDKYHIDKSMVNFEITETAATDSPKVLINNMNELAKRGIKFSLDDFGTGYSNINALMSMPLEIIKFDKSMIDMASSHEHGKSVIDSSVAMVKKMGLQIVAEGIEEKFQIEMLKEMGVDFLQGYFFSKPLTEAQFMEFIRKQNKTQTVKKQNKTRTRKSNAKHRRKDKK